MHPGSASGSKNPHLVPSYGTSVWNGNVALVQTFQSDLDRTFQMQSDRDNCVNTADLTLARELDPPGYSVDPDFQRALTNTGADR